MRLKLQLTSLRETTPMEYAKRFLFGGLVTVLASLVAEKWGPIVGGLFLAFPGIFPASISLVEKHKIQREAAESKYGIVAARREASVEAAGASAGAFGLFAFALVVWKAAGNHPLGLVLPLAMSGWLAVACLCWLIREKL
ncbi:MAG TPA: DUF3147 family protein [Acidobacteriaceae bacterium]